MNPQSSPQRRRRPSIAQSHCRQLPRGNRNMICFVASALLASCASTSVAATITTAAFVTAPSRQSLGYSSRRYYGIPRSENVILSSHGDDEAHELDCDIEHDAESSESIQSPSSPSINTRRQFFQQQLLASTPLIFPTAANAATDTTDDGYWAQRQQVVSQQKMQQQERADRRKKNTYSFKTKKWTPFINVNRWNSVETCLLEMLPVRNPVFRQLQCLIEDLEVFPTTDSESWKCTLLDAVATRALLDSKRSILEPVFNQEDPTELYISKSSLGESNIEALRSRLEDLIAIASGDIDMAAIDVRTASAISAGVDPKSSRRRNANNNNQNESFDNINMEEAGDIDAEAFVEAKRRALITLSELGELLVPSFPYAVPTRGKFSYLPRLLGRCAVTLSFERPSLPSSALGLNFGSISGIGGKQFLGNVTIIADGYAAPITAGNFVDLSRRNFYNGLSVKAMRKRLGVVPTFSDNVIMNDLTELRDNLDDLKDSALDFPETLKKEAKENSNRGGGVRGMFRSNKNGPPFTESLYDENRMTMDAVLPILGSFQEGFYDPLTAKPRRIPLEIVALDSTSPTRSTLTYSSSYAALDDDANGAGFGAGKTRYSALTSSSSAQRSFSSATSTSSVNSTAATYSTLDPVLSFDIPGLVALNHPDRVSNGASSEFFSLPRREVSTKRAALLDGQYAPFGYIVSGSDVYQSLRPGDVIRSTKCSEVGLLNLVKIRKSAFDGGGEDAIVVDESVDGGE